MIALLGSGLLLALRREDLDALAVAEESLDLCAQFTQGQLGFSVTGCNCGVALSPAACGHRDLTSAFRGALDVQLDGGRAVEELELDVLSRTSEFSGGLEHLLAKAPRYLDRRVIGRVLAIARMCNKSQLFSSLALVVEKYHGISLFTSPGLLF